MGRNVFRWSKTECRNVIWSKEDRRQKFEIQVSCNVCRQDCCGIVVWRAVVCRNVCRGARTTVGVDERLLAYLQDGLELFV